MRTLLGHRFEERRESFLSTANALHIIQFDLFMTVIYDFVQVCPPLLGIRLIPSFNFDNPYPPPPLHTLSLLSSLSHTLSLPLRLVSSFRLCFCCFGFLFCCFLSIVDNSLPWASNAPLFYHSSDKAHLLCC